MNNGVYFLNSFEVFILSSEKYIKRSLGSANRPSCLKTILSIGCSSSFYILWEIQFLWSRFLVMIERA